MDALLLAIAAIGSIAAIVARFTGAPTWLMVAGIVVAACALVGYVVRRAKTYQDAARTPITLDDEQEKTIRSLLSEGRESTAIGQIQLWFRGSTPQQAREVVASLRR